MSNRAKLNGNPSPEQYRTVTKVFVPKQSQFRINSVQDAIAETKNIGKV